ncbi:hypothetical protein ACEZDB_25395 [Streptacidiphilus sp. N1-3]|uniref:DUF3137 domain-containing protein n=1 Tax=Streptacidiphilus alkalitolerans TaxID=3342712 RepID=A0ABV6X741_9ACTN
MTLTPVLALPLLLVLIAAAVGVAFVRRAGRSGRRAEQALAAAVASRPGWTGSAAPDGAWLSRRYRYQSPFNGPNPAFGAHMSGPLPSGAQAEVFHFGTAYWHAGAPVTAGWTVAAVVLPRPLPEVLLQPGYDALPPGWPPGPGRTYDEAGSGPQWAGLRGYALDPQAASAVFVPEVLGRSRALGLDWRMTGRTVLALAPDRRLPAAMLELVDHLVWFASLFPEEVLLAVAEQPDPWAGPSAERPA